MQKLLRSQVHNVADLNVLETVHDIDGNEVTSTVCLGNAPWEDDDVLRDKLEEAGWRYAVLIGITDGEGSVSPEHEAADKSRYSHLIVEYDGAPCWDSSAATGFVCELTGVSREVAAAWLNLDWIGGGEV